MLGPYDSPKSRVEYARIIGEYLANKTPQSRTAKREGRPCFGPLVVDYVSHLKTYYGDVTETANCKRALKPLTELYVDFYVEDFGPLQFKAVRDAHLQDKNRSRGYVNGLMARVLRFLKWAVGEGVAPSSIYESCKCVAPLKRGKCSAKESDPVEPVDLSLVNATLPFMTQVLADMVRFQLATACRSGELIQITPAMVDRTSSVWIIEMDRHKTANSGKDRTLYLGPKAQAILAPYLLRGEDVPCFSPTESEAQRLAAKHAARVTPLSCGNKPGSRRVNRTRAPKNPPSDRFSTGTYGRAIKNSCVRADQKHWTPHQLRHTAATEIRKQFGLEAAQVILGHSEMNVTQIYAEKNRALAIKVARKIG
jgi:integrase